jgi:hypothetical protein
MWCGRSRCPRAEPCGRRHADRDDADDNADNSYPEPQRPNAAPDRMPDEGMSSFNASKANPPDFLEPS